MAKHDVTKTTFSQNFSADCSEDLIEEVKWMLNKVPIALCRYLPSLTIEKTRFHHRDFCDAQDLVPYDLKVIPCNFCGGTRIISGAIAF